MGAGGASDELRTTHRASQQLETGREGPPHGQQHDLKDMGKYVSGAYF